MSIQIIIDLINNPNKPLIFGIGGFFCYSEVMGVKKKNTKLSDKQERFFTEYLIDLNASSAAIREGYSANGINKRVTRMMANEGIQIRISELQAKTSAKLEIKKEDNLKILRTIRDADLTRFMQFNGSRLTFTSFANIPKELMICVKSVKENVDKSGNRPGACGNNCRDDFGAA
jgi:hypothetical protein